jgi:glutaconate CoA-transferase subunit B
MCDLPNLYQATACAEMQDVMALLQAGHVALGFQKNSKEMYLASYHPGVAVEEVRANTGWDLLVADDVTRRCLPQQRS